MKIQIKDNLEIGDGCPPFIIAEVGSNWRTLEDCMTSISMAKACGAHAVKFQAFDDESLYGIKVKRGYAGPHGESVYECGKHPSALPLEWLPKLKEKADACGIEFMCSAFSPELVAAVDPFVNLHKVASAEMTHVRILEKLRSFGKPVILSTGASGVDDIQQALEVLAQIPTILMYCVAAYPAQEITLETIQTIKASFGGPVGYSDHSTDVLHIPVSAVRDFGACVLEKHFTAIDGDTPDAPHSLNSDQFKRMVTHIGQGGEGVIGPTREETPMILRHNRRLIATKDIAVGEPLTEGVNFGIYRSLKDDTHAYSPWMVDDVRRCKAVRAIGAGCGIGPGDVG
jgi:N-acetylneuraminate synthase